MIEVARERPAPGGCQSIFSLRGTACERLRAIDIARVLQLARMDAQITVTCFDRMLQFIECQRFFRRQGADDSQSQTLVNQTIDFMSSVRRALNTVKPLLLTLSTL